MRTVRPQGRTFRITQPYGLRLFVSKNAFEPSQGILQQVVSKLFQQRIGVYLIYKLGARTGISHSMILGRAERRINQRDVDRHCTRSAESRRRRGGDDLVREIFQLLTFRRHIEPSPHSDLMFDGDCREV